MKKLKQIIGVALITISMLMLMTACGLNKNIVAVIEGEKIPESLYRIYLWDTQQFYEKLFGEQVWEMELDGQNTEEIAKERALVSTILSVVVSQKAEEMGIELDKEQRSEAKENAKSFVEKNPDIIETYQFGEEDVERLLIATEYSKEIQIKMSENYMPSEQEITRYVKDYKSKHEEVRVRHILLKTTDENMHPLPEETINEKKSLAKKLLQRALNGEDMGELAKTYSEDSASKDEGGLITFTRGKMVLEFEKVAFENKDGQVWPELVETAYGYHIIKTEEHIFDEEQVREDYIEQEKNKFADNEFDELVKNAKVEKKEAYEDIHIIRPNDERQK